MAIPKLITKKKKKEKQKKGKPTVLKTKDEYGDPKTVLLPSRKTLRKAKRKEKKGNNLPPRLRGGSVGRPISIDREGNVI